MTHDLHCPMCGTELDMGHLMVASGDRAAFLRLMDIALPMPGLISQYVRLFAPPKTALTQRKQARIILELLPDLQRCAITHRGRTWPTPLALWEAAIEQMLQARDAGRLELPMKGHGYLYTILVSLADKHEAALEHQAEAAKRAPATHTPHATYQVRGEMLPMGQALAQVFGGRDPALARLDAEKGQESGMPAHLRQRLADLKNPSNQHPK